MMSRATPRLRLLAVPALFAAAAAAALTAVPQAPASHQRLGVNRSGSSDVTPQTLMMKVATYRRQRYRVGWYNACPNSTSRYSDTTTSNGQTYYLRRVLVAAAQAQGVQLLPVLSTNQRLERDGRLVVDAKGDHVRACPVDKAAYAAEMARMFPSITHWEIGNEPDLLGSEGCYWSAADWKRAELVPMGNAIHAVDPGDRVIAGGTAFRQGGVSPHATSRRCWGRKTRSQSWRKFMDAAATTVAPRAGRPGAGRRPVDAIAVHPYAYTGRGSEQLLKKARARAANYPTAHQVWATEVGWGPGVPPTRAGQTGEQAQAGQAEAFKALAYPHSCTGTVAPAYAWQLNDTPTGDSSRNYGNLDFAGLFSPFVERGPRPTPKPLSGTWQSSGPARTGRRRCPGLRKRTSRARARALR